MGGGKEVPANNGLYSALKNNETMMFARKWIQLEVVEQTMLAAEGKCYATHRR